MAEKWSWAEAGRTGKWIFKTDVQIEVRLGGGRKRVGREMGKCHQAEQIYQFPVAALLNLYLLHTIHIILYASAVYRAGIHYQPTLLVQMSIRVYPQCRKSLYTASSLPLIPDTSII